MIIEELFRQYEQYARRRYAASTVYAVRAATRACGERYRDWPIEAFGPAALSDVRDSLLGSVRPTTARARAATLVRIWRWAASRELVPVERYAALRTLEPLRYCAYRPVRPAPMDAVDAVLAVLPATLAAMVRLQLLTGARPQEVCRLTPGEIDKGDLLWMWRPKRHKGVWRGLKREILIGPRGQRILSPFLLRPEDRPCFNSCTTTHSAYTTTSYNRAIARVCERAGVAHWHVNQLRHNFATEIRRQYGLEAAAILLGHSSARLTDEVYAERDRSLAARIMGLSG